MDDNQQKQEKNESNSNFGNTFVKSSSSAYAKSVPKSKKEHTFFKSVFLPLVFGIVGASLILMLCFYVPAVRKIFTGTSSDNVEKIFTATGPVSQGVDISEYSGTAISVANKVLPSVVGIEVDFSVSANYPTFYAAQQSTTSTATGSGVIISKDGYILTNNHVIDTSSSSSNYYSVSEANSVKIYLHNETEPIEAKIIGSDSLTDLAVLKIDKDNLTAIEFGDSDSVQVGEFAMAIGSPLDMRNTVTSGIISGTHREIKDSDGTMYTLLQTDAAINAGNSGGALVNADGKLIGINTLKMAGTGIEGMGFAIPVNSTLDITQELIANGKVKRPYIGFTGVDVTAEQATIYRIPIGVYVYQLESDGPAKKSDLKVGDVILKFNGKDIKTMSELNNLKNECKIGDTITLTVSRDGKEREIEIKLAEQP